MPYKVEGSNVMHYKGGKWHVKQHCSSPTNARRAMALLRGVEHGWHPTGKKSKRNYVAEELEKGKKKS